jgi:CDP-paratose 2-epimerase
VRDCLHPADLVPLLDKQLAGTRANAPQVVNVSGGTDSAFSLLQLSDWCRGALGPHQVTADPRERPFDLPWLVLDFSEARRVWDWRPTRRRVEILDEILRHARANPSWLELSAAS